MRDLRISALVVHLTAHTCTLPFTPSIPALLIVAFILVWYHPSPLSQFCTRVGSRRDGETTRHCSIGSRWKKLRASSIDDEHVCSGAADARDVRVAHRCDEQVHAEGNTASWRCIRGSCEDYVYPSELINEVDLVVLLCLMRLPKDRSLCLERQCMLIHVSHRAACRSRTRRIRTRSCSVRELMSLNRGHTTSSLTLLRTRRPLLGPYFG